MKYINMLLQIICIYRIYIIEYIEYNSFYFFNDYIWEHSKISEYLNFTVKIHIFKVYLFKVWKPIYNLKLFIIIKVNFRPKWQFDYYP